MVSFLISYTTVYEFLFRVIDWSQSIVITFDEFSFTFFDIILSLINIDIGIFVIGLLYHLGLNKGVFEG